jgi:putative spermidine/putrescine transport system ATP-binding protein
VVRDVVYLGSGLRVEIVLPDGRPLVARVPSSGGVHPAPGLPVLAHWASRDSLIVADDTVGRTDDDAAA